MSLQALYPLLVDFEHLITALTAFNLSQLFNIFRKLNKYVIYLFANNATNKVSKLQFEEFKRMKNVILVLTLRQVVGELEPPGGVYTIRYTSHLKKFPI